jgi:uncharacterized protein (TIGR00369 family)
MGAYAPRDPEFEARVRRSFANLTLMRTVGARLLRVSPGEVEIDLPFRDDLTQQHGFLAGAVVTAIVDVACGYAAMTLMPPGASVLTIECKVNFLSPVQRERLLARGRVVRPGRMVTVCAGDVVALIGGREKIVATMLGTMATVNIEGGELPPSEGSAASANDCRGGSHQRRSSRPARPWCVCRGEGLGRRLRDIVRSTISRDPERAVAHPRTLLTGVLARLDRLAGACTAPAWSGAPDRQLLHPRVERVRVELELCCRVARAPDAPVAGFERAEDMLPLHVLECPRATSDGGRRPCGLGALPDLAEQEHGARR